MLFAFPDELLTNDLSLNLRITDTPKGIDKFIPGIDHIEIEIREESLNSLSLPFSHKSGIDIY